MQKVYIVKVTKGYSGNDFAELRVLAPNVAKAVANAERYVKKNYYSNSEIISIELYCKVDVFYKS